MAAGAVPVVANSGGSAAIVTNNKNGLLAKPFDAKDFLRQTLYLISHPEEQRRLHEAGIEYAKQYDWEKMLARFFDLYTRIRRDGA